MWWKYQKTFSSIFLISLAYFQLLPKHIICVAVHPLQSILFSENIKDVRLYCVPIIRSCHLSLSWAVVTRNRKDWDRAWWDSLLTAPHIWEDPRGSRRRFERIQRVGVQDMCSRVELIWKKNKNLYVPINTILTNCRKQLYMSKCCCLVIVSLSSWKLAC